MDLLACFLQGEKPTGALLTFCPDSLCVDVNVFFCIVLYSDEDRQPVFMVSTMVCLETCNHQMLEK